MGKHAAPAENTHPTEVELERVASLLESLGFEPLVRPDRLVVGAHAFIASFWVDYNRPMCLVFDLSLIHI